MDDLLKQLVQQAAVVGAMVTITISPPSFFDDESDAPKPERDDAVRAEPDDGVAYATKDAEYRSAIYAGAFRHGDRVMLVTSLETFLDDDKANRDRPTRLERGELAIELRSYRGPIEEGYIIGVSTYSDGSPPSYLVRYRAGDGCQRESWHSEGALVAYPG